MTRIKPRLRFALIMRAMLRAISLLRGRRIIGWVMGGFLLSVLLAGVAPWMQSGGFDQICSANGNLTRSSTGSEDSGLNSETGSTPGRLHGTLQCGLCLPLDMPAVAESSAVPVKQAHTPVATADQGRSVEWLRWTALPARAPPPAV